MSAPEAACARAISGKLRYLPVPTMRREWKGRPAITSWSDMEILNSILDPRATRNKSRRTVSQNHTAQEGRIYKMGATAGMCGVHSQALAAGRNRGRRIWKMRVFDRCFWGDKGMRMGANMRMKAALLVLALASFGSGGYPQSKEIEIP